MALPAWSALTVQVPVVSRVRVLPATVQTPVVAEAKPTARPELEVAASGPWLTWVGLWAGKTLRVGAPVVLREQLPLLAGAAIVPTSPAP